MHKVFVLAMPYVIECIMACLTNNADSNRKLGNLATFTRNDRRWGAKKERPV